MAATTHGRTTPRRPTAPGKANRTAARGGVAPGGDLAGLAALLADGTRAAICLALLDGRAWTAGELATRTGVTAPTASEHLSRLINGGLLIERRQGRHRYVQLADARVAELLEDLTAFTEPRPRPVRSLRAATASAALARGRTCYDHLAGRLGVAITDGMTRAGLLDQVGGFALTDAGLIWLTTTLGVEPTALTAGRRPVARPCLDWTERRTHLAGSAGAQIRRRFDENGWTRAVGAGRAVRLTPAGGAALRDLLDLDPTPLL
ncbi:MAG: ArsR/SmtB family transcription factor [Frankia sp.]